VKTFQFEILVAAGYYQFLRQFHNNFSVEPLVIVQLPFITFFGSVRSQEISCYLMSVTERYSE
tara:strand:+ start:2301 stop:2489 length:189 start_codon:yes stop_codon:yes gene_type:complete